MSISLRYFVVSFKIQNLQNRHWTYPANAASSQHQSKNSCLNPLLINHHFSQQKEEELRKEATIELEGLREQLEVEKGGVERRSREEIEK